MKKPIIFISHIAEEKEIAIELKRIITSRYVGAINVFVSSDPQSISGGERWLDKIEFALKKCNLELILCSKDSVKKPWINFEAGAGWIRNIPVMPLCHMGLNFKDLPTPLNMLEAVDLFDKNCLKLIFSKISELNDLSVPDSSADDFIAMVKNFSIDSSMKKLGILKDNMFDILGNYCIHNKVKSVVSYADRNAIKLDNNIISKKHIKAYIDFSNIPKDDINQNFVMVFLKYLTRENWSSFFEKKYKLKFKYKFSDNIKGIQLEIKNSQMDKIVDEFVTNDSNAFELDVSNIGNVNLWEDINEFCFTLFYGEDFIEGEKGEIEIYDLMFSE